MLVSKSVAFLGMIAMGSIQVSSSLSSATDIIPCYSEWKSIKYSTVTGFFAQDLPETDENTFDFIASNFGLLDEFQLYLQPTHSNHQADKRPPWNKFEEAIKHLNAHAPKNVQYKVLYLGRHGQGYHNVAESFYGTELWDCYWSKLDGNGTISWFDAQLTPTGISEAQKVKEAWKTQINYGVPLPQVYYSSPLRRAASTLLITWQELTLDKPHAPPRPIVKEKLREAIGVHTCDKRSKRSFLEKEYPTFQFPPLNEFPEDDPLWDPAYRERTDARAVRLKAALDEIFASELGMKSDYISITAHSGTIASILEVINHRVFKLPTGAMIPAVIKVEYSSDEEKKPVLGPGDPAPTCTKNPTPTPN